MASALSYIERLLDDDYVQENIGEAAVRLRAAYGRASDRRAGEAVQDEKLYEQLRGAAASLVNAVRVLGGEPSPKRGLRRFLVPAVVLAALALATNEGLRARISAMLSPRFQSDPTA